MAEVRRPWMPLFAAVFASLPARAELVIREIVIHGAEKTTARAVEARIQMRSGDPITFDTLSLARERLLATGLFSDVDVTIGLPREEAVQAMYLDSHTRAVDMNVWIEEKRSWFVFPFLTAGGSDLWGGLVYVDRNLGGHAVEMGGAGQYGGSKGSVQVGFRDPMMTFAPLTYGVGGYYRREDFRFFEGHRRVQEVPTRVAGGEGRFGYVFSSHTRALVGGGYKRIWIDDPALLALAGGQVEPAAPYACPEGTLLDADGQPAARAQPYNCAGGDAATLLFDLTYDRTMAPRGLRTGALVSFRNEIADSTWGSDFDYVRLQFKLGLYGSLGRNYPSANLRSAFVLPTSANGTPLTEIVRVGGGNLRGYLVNEFRGDTLVSLQLEDQVYLFEIRRPWRLSLAAAVFADTAALLERHPAGRVPAEAVPGAEPRIRLDDFHTSLGGGLRFLLPGVAIPAIRVDVGYGFDVRDYAVTFTIASEG